MSEGRVATSRDIRNALIRWMELPADTTLTLSKLGDMMEDSFAKHRAVLAPYYQDMVECIEAQETALIASQARLSEAVKVLEAYLNEYEGVYDMAATKERPAHRSDGAKAAEDAARNFLASLGEENEA